MKRVLYIVSALLLLAGCAKEQNANEEVHQIPLNISIAFDAQTRAGGSETIAPVVNSVRVLGFDANDADKPCVLNEFFPFGYTVMKTTSSYLVQMSTPITINSQSTKYDLYVILNEESYQLTSQSGDATIKDILTDFTEGDSKESDFTAIYNTLANNDKTDVTGNPVGEPAFLMCASSLDYEITEAEQKLPEPQEVQFIVEGGRTMAQIIINKITSEPNGEDKNDASVSKIFVVGVSLENVPSTIDWNAPSTDATGATPMSSIPVGAAVTDDNGTYYKRIWPGFLTTQLEVNATRTLDCSEYLYRTGLDGAGNWKFSDILEYDNKGHLTTPQPVDYPYYDMNYLWDSAKDKNKNDLTKYKIIGDGDQKKRAINAPTYVDKDFFKKDDDAHVRGILDRKIFTEDADHFFTSFVINSITTDLSSPISGTALSCTDDYWTVNLGQKYYVPENIVTSSAAATCIKVRLAVADPSLTLPTGTDAIKDYPVPGQFKLTADNTYTNGDLYLGGLLMTSVPDALPKAVKDTVAAHTHYVWANDHDREAHTGDETSINSDKDIKGNENLDPMFHVYVDGFKRVHTAQANITVNQNQKGSTFSWNIPYDPNDPTTYKEFIIPVNNNLDGSYSVKRNTRYSVTLHVNNETMTRAGGDGISITATVETEKINDYED